MRPRTNKRVIFSDVDFWGETASVAPEEMIAVLIRSARFASTAHAHGEEMIMVDRRTFAILTAMAGMWVEDNGQTT